MLLKLHTYVTIVLIYAAFIRTYKNLKYVLYYDFTTHTIPPTVHIFFSTDKNYSCFFVYNV